MGPHFGISAYFSLIYPHVKAATPCQKAPFHVAAVNQQARSAKMLINLTWWAAMLCALIWNSDWWIGALRGSQGETDSNQFRAHFWGSPTPHLISRCNCHTRLHTAFHFLLLVMDRHGFASEAETNGGFIGSGNEPNNRSSFALIPAQRHQRQMRFLRSSTQTVRLNKRSIQKIQLPNTSTYAFLLWDVLVSFHCDPGCFGSLSSWVDPCESNF